MIRPPPRSTLFPYPPLFRSPLEEHLLVMAPPRTYKTAFLADVILRYPGPVIATTTKADVYQLTAAVRAEQGRVHVFNPRSEEHTSELQSQSNLVCRLLLEKK